MKLGPHASLSDAGRKRLRNEDSYAVNPPLFVVADGMGGAQAGELASSLTAEVFREARPDAGGDAQARLRELILEANGRVFERSRTSADLAGMGTTVTAALVEDGRISFGHVGDSRAYRIRDGAIEQLTDDHSLVADLVRAGRLSPEEAEVHPQRSVITRALGTDPSVEVDTFAVEAREGDVYLLCSDGLTTMVGSETLLRATHDAESLPHAARELIRAANRAGGEDNITVVLFALVDDAWVEPEPSPADETQEAPVLGPDEDTLSGLEGIPFVDAPGPDVTRVQQVVTMPAEAPVPPRRWWRRILSRRKPWVTAGVILVLLLVAAAVAAVVGLRSAHFVGATAQGRLAVYQGVPWDVTSGVRLYRAVYVSGVDATWLTPDERKELFDHELVSERAALERVAVFERELQAP
ncbi:MAG: Stp1/IreP family PP2C-type Ser/Thr phosphatase [Thermoleophilia bacterium]